MRRDSWLLTVRCGVLWPVGISGVSVSSRDPNSPQSRPHHPVRSSYKVPRPLSVDDKSNLNRNLQQNQFPFQSFSRLRCDWSWCENIILVFSKLRDSNLCDDPSSNTISRNYSIYHQACHQTQFRSNNRLKSPRNFTHSSRVTWYLRVSSPRFFTIKLFERRAGDLAGSELKWLSV